MEINETADEIYKINLNRDSLRRVYRSESIEENFSGCCFTVNSALCALHSEICEHFVYDFLENVAVEEVNIKLKATHTSSIRSRLLV